MLLKLFKHLFPQHREKQIELSRASSSVTLTIARYQNMSMELQKEIERNRFARYLLYDKGETHGDH